MFSSVFLQHASDGCVPLLQILHFWFICNLFGQQFTWGEISLLHLVESEHTKSHCVPLHSSCCFYEQWNDQYVLLSQFHWQSHVHKPHFPLSIVLRSIFASSLHITLWNLWVPLSPFCFCNLDCSLYVVMISLGLKILINPERFWCSPLSSCSCVRNKIFNVFCYRQYNFETYAFQ